MMPKLYVKLVFGLENPYFFWPKLTILSLNVGGAAVLGNIPKKQILLTPAFNLDFFKRHTFICKEAHD